ncbi:MAG TPA: ABC transporter ATP-binding protein [Chloroflexota bacterium]|nr:ABC transporter ATP-binding protein [Chloroflexota bacterium]
MDGKPPQPLLEFQDVDTYYGSLHILKGVNYRVNQGEIVALLGANGAGKTTTMKTILGIVKPRQGQVWLEGKRIDGSPTRRVIEMGVAPVPEGRRVFPKLTVLDNLKMGAWTRKDKHVQEDMDRVYALFPRLHERRNQTAGTLSGGEQQMLAIGRALMARPRLMIMDEPSMGLSPILTERVFDTVVEINKQGTTIFMVEQNAYMALQIAGRGYVLQTGEVVLEDTAANLLASDTVRKAYLGES